MFRVNEADNIKMEDYADSIYEYLLSNDLSFDVYDYDDFAMELDNAIQNGEIVQIPELDREDAFKLAIEKTIEDEYSDPESMDGDWDSSMKSAGWGNDEDYGNASDMYEEYDSDDDEKYDDKDLVSMCHGVPIEWRGGRRICPKCKKALGIDDILSKKFYQNEDDFDCKNNSDLYESVINDTNQIIKMLNESLVSKKAKKLGLVHVGFGNYAEEPGGPAQYKTVNGKLKKVKGKGPKKPKPAEKPKEKPKEKEEPKKDTKPKKTGITDVRRVSGEKFTYEFMKDGRKYKFTLNKMERKELKGEGSIMDIIKQRMKKKEAKQKSKLFKKGQHVAKPK